MKKLLKLLCVLTTSVYLLTLPSTYAKYLSSNTGIAWQTAFTTFSILKDIFTVENENGEESVNLWGASTNPDNTLDGYNGDYTLGNLKEVEFNIYNKTTEDMVVTFEITYYIPTSGFFTWATNGITFGIYNTTLHFTPNDSDILKGELVTEAVGSKYSLPDISATVTADSYKGEGILGLVTYYQVIAKIDPYTFIKANPTLYTDELLEQFIISIGEAYSYNLSVYYGDYNSTADSYNSCFAAVEMHAVPLSNYS